MNCIIIEDELNSRILLQEVLSKYFPNLKLLGVGTSVDEGVELLEKLNPDLVLLDIEINGGTGFEMLDRVTNLSTRVIFITGYEHYALKAIKYSAVDYLLKPLSVEELRAAVGRAAEDKENQEERMSVLKQNLKQTELPPCIMVPSRKGLLVLQVNDINYLEAQGPYVFVHMTDGRKILASHALGYYEELLGDALFFRVHKSFLVNVGKVRQVITTPVPKLHLDNGAEVDLAFRRKQAFMERFKTINRG